MGLGWQFFGLQTYVIIGRPRFEDQTLATWHRGSGIRMGWWPSSRCPLEMGQLGHLRPMGTYGHLWAPMGTYGHLQNGQLRVFEFNMAMDPIQ